MRDFVAKFTFKISSYAGEKIETRLYELNKHIGYFQSFLQTKKILQTKQTIL